MSDLEGRMRARLAELEQSRERFIGEAQRTLAAHDAAIAEIKTLLDPPPAEQNGMTDESVDDSLVAAVSAGPAMG